MTDVNSSGAGGDRRGPCCGMADTQACRCHTDADTLEECFGRVTGDALLSLAVRFGATRLIDNVVLHA